MLSPPNVRSLLAVLLAARGITPANIVKLRSEGPQPVGLHDHFDKMKLWADHGGFGARLRRVIGRLARSSPSAATVASALCLLLIVSLDTLARTAELRLVPLYVPALCVICWALGRWRALLFAAAAALIAISPDVLASAAPFSPATAANALIRAIAYIFLALIIVNYRSTYDEAHLRATYDGLTGVLNASSFHAAAAKKIMAARRRGQTLIAVNIDVAGLPDIPAAHGLSSADSALRAVARTAMDSIRGSDLVGRLGWHQFGFVVHVPSEHQAEPLARLLHERLSVALTKTGLPLSCTMGMLVISPRSTLSDIEAFDTAHRMVRTAKERGETVAIRDDLPA